MSKKHLHHFHLRLCRYLTLTGLIWLFSSCVDKMSLPTDISMQGGSFTGDTTYLRLNPIWDEDNGYQFLTPIEISIAQDGHIFIADSSSQRIFVIDQGGKVLEEFEPLTNLIDEEGNSLSPIDVDVDQKMNVFFIDGSRRVYRWNQIWNDLGIDSIAISATFIKNTTDSTVSPGSEEWLKLANSEEWELYEVEWSTDDENIDSLLNPHLFFDAGTPGNEAADTYFNSSLSLFSGISTSGNNDFFYVTDEYFERIVRIDFERSHFIKLGSGNEVWVHKGVFKGSKLKVANWGTGAGTVNDPVAIDVDYDGNIYYAQLGNYFSIHKIHEVTGDYTTYPSVFQPGQNEIMELFRFADPMDVAVDKSQFIYVANTGEQEIQVFNSYGNFFKKAGIQKVIVDTTIWEINVIDTTELDTSIWIYDPDTVLVDTTLYIFTYDSTAIDTFYTSEEKGILQSPRAVAVDDRGVIYVCDTPNSRIVRYRLSNILEEDIIPEN